MNTKMQQAMEATHRPSNLTVLRTIGAQPSDSSVTREFEMRNGATRPFPGASLVKLFNMVPFTSCCLEQPRFELTSKDTRTLQGEQNHSDFSELPLLGTQS
jgi:hypothetical protein